VGIFAELLHPAVHRAMAVFVAGEDTPSRWTVLATWNRFIADPTRSGISTVKSSP
jgi:hypothetical protein